MQGAQLMRARNTLLRGQTLDQNETSTATTTVLRRRTIARRMCFAVIGSLICKPAFARPSLGDKEWLRRFRQLVKTFNAFLEILNEGKFDVAKWNAVRTAWKDVDVT